MARWLHCSLPTSAFLLSWFLCRADVPPPSPNPWTLMTTVIVPGAVQAGAVYPDSSPARFELNFTGSPGWVVHLSGGGWRFLSNETDSNLTSPAPSLTHDGAAPSDAGCYGHCDGIMSTDPSQNPLFHRWNKVFIPISGSSFTGDRHSDAPYPVRGARILASVIQHLQSTYNMSQAEEVILTGGSSGGLATYLTCDRVGAMVRAPDPSIRYSCLADAGFFLDHLNWQGRQSTSIQFEQSFFAWNSSAGTNQDCVAHYTPLGTPEKCIFAQYVLPFIKSDLFIMQNLYDSWQLANILQVTGAGACQGYGHPGVAGCTPAQVSAIQKYGATMRTLLAQNSHRSIYAPSCIAHCQSVENEHPAALWNWIDRWSIGNTTPAAAFNAWYQGASMQLMQPCNWSSTQCNTKCPLYT